MTNENTKTSRPPKSKQPGEEQGKVLRRIVDQYPKSKVMVIGDFISDVYIYGKPISLSREAPVVVIRHEWESVVPGGAGNATNNLASLGCQVYAVGILGNDDLGNALITQLKEKKVNVEGLLLSHIVNTTSKTRIMAGDDHTSKQQVIRIDRGSNEPIPARLQEKIYEHFSRLSGEVDAIVVSDYGYGVLSPRIISTLKLIAMKKTVVVDSRYQTNRFRGVTAITPNESEAAQAARVELAGDKDVDQAAKFLRSKLQLDAVLITRGNRGMTLLDKSSRVYHIDIVGKDDVTDVTGAGDTVATVFTLSLASGASFYDAARLANYAAGIVVMKRGTAVATRTELLEAVRKSHG